MPQQVSGLRRFESLLLGIVFAAGVALGVLGFALLQMPQQLADGVTTFAFAPSCTNGTVRPVFSPGADAAIVAEINSAQKGVDVEIYQFSFAGTKEALVNAVARDVPVRLILEPRVDSNYDTADFLSKRGVQVRWANTNYANTHSKFAVFDSEKVLVGSINWSRHAMELNREAAVVVGDAKVAQEFEQVFEADWGAASPVK
ncbi:MAG: phospholipase D family protein [Candidatus Micrarchaeia archaeon]|jgi:phosphatidylserine/phosphatidylglycerophosphate/cardiolipin synthase-like enzyme